MAVSNAWRLNGSLRDFGGLRNHMSPIGGTPIFEPGHSGLALACRNGRGASAYLDVWRYYYAVAREGMTVECWVTSSSASTAVRTAVSKGGAWALDISDGSGFVRFRHGSYVINTTADVIDGDPHHVMVTYEVTSANPYIYSYRIYVDGVLVKTDTGNATTYNDSTADLVYVGLQGSTQGAEALIEDVRIYGDPVAEDEVITQHMSTPVADFELGVWDFGLGSGSQVEDNGRLNNDFFLTSNGVRGTGFNGRTAVVPVNPSGSWTAEAPITVEKPIDRLSMQARFCLARTGVAQRVLEFSRTDGGNPILAFDIAADGTATLHGWADDGSHWTTTQTAEKYTSTSTWYTFDMSMYPVAIRWRIGTSIAYSPSSGSYYPRNAPAYSNQSTLRLNGKWQDIKLVETFVDTNEYDGWRTQPLVSTWNPVYSGIVDGDGTPMAAFLLGSVGSVEVVPAFFSGAEADTLPPSTPSNLRVVAVGSNSFTVAWDASTDADQDVTAPSTPTSVEAHDITSSGFTVGWSGSSDS